MARQSLPHTLRSIAACTLFVAAFIVIHIDTANAEESATTPRVDLGAAANSVFSQFGEDGIIQKIFEIIEPGPKYCVEFGAYDGVKNSNMRNLIVNHGWSSFQIEGNPGRAKALAKNYADYPNVKTQQGWVWPGNIEILFEDAGVPKDLDLLVIDIDSNDYYVWRAIHDFRPKLVMIEANGQFPAPELMVVDFHPMNFWDGTHYNGASLQSLYNLAKQKGYELVHYGSGPNAFFVDAKYYDRFGIEDNSPVNMAAKLPPEIWKKARVAAGRDGVPWPAGQGTLEYENLVIEKKFILDR